jgi:hypothetical protein
MASLHAAAREALAAYALEKRSGIYLEVDVDPVSML